MSRARPGRHWRVAVASALLALFAAGGSAGAVPPGLESLAPSWEQLPAERRAELQGRAALWERWSEAEREAFLARMTEWDALDRDEQARRRMRYRAWQSLSNYDRARVRAAATGFGQLPPGEQQELLERFQGLDERERLGWLLGPELGADYPALQPLLAQVPEHEHEGLLAALRGMNARERADLAVLVQRTSPQDRDQLRRELISTAAANRGQWLRMRLGR